MKKKSIIILFLIIILANALMPMKVQAKKQVDFFDESITFSSEFVSSGYSMPYALFTPSTAEEGKKIPLIVWLHGSGELTYKVSASGFMSAGLPAVFKNWRLEGFSAYILCPQNNTSWNNATAKDKLQSLIDRFIEEHSVDTSNIIICGHSMGGRGAQYMAHQMPGYFSKCAVLSGYNPGINISEITIPAKGYVGTTAAGEDSSSVSYMNRTFASVFGSENTVSLNASHGDVPRVAFNIDNDNNNRSDLIEWMFDGVEIETDSNKSEFLQDDDDMDEAGDLFIDLAEILCFVPDVVLETLQNMFVSENSIETEDGDYKILYAPGTIFSGKIPAFDINYINTSKANTLKKTKTSKEYVTLTTALKLNGAKTVTEEEYTKTTGWDTSYNTSTELVKDNMKYNELKLINLDSLEGNKNTEVKSTVDGSTITKTETLKDVWYDENNNKVYLIVDSQTTTITSDGRSSNSSGTIIGYKINSKDDLEEAIALAGTESEIEVGDDDREYKSTTKILQSVISTWYNALRRIALVGLLSVLVYIGIKILITSTSAKDKAKYKHMLKDWLIALCILFTLHYIMSITLTVIENLNNVIGASAIGESGEDILVSTIRNDIANGKNWGQVIVQVILYCIIGVYTVIFTIQYLRRTIYIAFLTMIAPLITLTYPLDKIKDKKSQAFDMWLKDYIFFALLQIVHLLLYYILVGSSINLSHRENWIFAIVAIGFMTKAEKIVKEMFGFNKSKTLGAVAAGATGALVMNAINKIGHKPPKGGKPGGGSGKESSGSVRTATNNPLGTGKGNGGGAKTAKGIENLGKDFLKTHGKGLASGIIGTGTGLAGEIIGLSSGLAQGDIGAALTGAIAGGTAGMNISKNLVNSATSIPGRYRKTVNSIKDTYRTGAYGEEAAKAMRFDEDFRKGSTYEAIKNNGNFSEEKLQTMLNAGITEKKAMTKILDSGMDIDSAVKYYTLAQNCPESILYGDESTLARYITDRDSSINEADAKIMAKNIGKFK